MDDLLEALQFAEARLEELGEQELVGKCAAAFAKYKAEQEPVAWVEVERGVPMFAKFSDKYKPNGDGFIQLYAAPVRTKDLTDFEIDCIRFNLESGKTWIDFARAVIAAYKEKNK